MYYSCAQCGFFTEDKAARACPRANAGYGGCGGVFLRRQGPGQAGGGEPVVEPEGGVSSGVHAPVAGAASGSWLGSVTAAASNDNPPFDRKGYQREYMRKYRARLKEAER
jgi:hypothetical protein